MPAWFNSVWPVATFFLGGASAYLRDFLTEKRQIARETKARQAERDKAITDRREAFELDHLERLNEALQTLGRAAGRVHFIDMQNGRESGQYAMTRLPDEANETHSLANREVHMLRGLVLNDQLRTKVDQAHEALNRPSNLNGVPIAQAERVFHEAVLLLNAVQADIAARIREIYLTADTAVPGRRGGGSRAQ